MRERKSSLPPAAGLFGKASPAMAARFQTPVNDQNLGADCKRPSFAELALASVNLHREDEIAA